MYHDTFISVIRLSTSYFHDRVEGQRDLSFDLFHSSSECLQNSWVSLKLA